MGIRVVSRVVPRPYADRDGDFFMIRENVPRHILYFKMTEKGNDSDERKITEHQGRGVKGY